MSRRGVGSAEWGIKGLVVLSIMLLMGTSVGIAQTATADAKQAVLQKVERTLDDLVLLSDTVDAKQAVLQKVEQFLEDLGALRIDAVAKHLTPDALIVTVRKRGDSMESTTTTGKAWIHRLKMSKTKFEEPIHNVHITIDSEALAYVRADFIVYIAENTLSHGVDQFTLIKTSDGWKIAAAAYTSIPGLPEDK